VAAREDADVSGPPRPGPGGLLLGLLAIAVLAFLCLPIAIVVPMSFSSADSLTFPPPSLSLRWYDAFFGDSRWVDAGLNSLALAFISSSVALVFGTLAAYALVRGRFVGRRVLESNFVAPMIIPPVITAVAIYIFFAKTRILGSFYGLIAAHTVLSAPYVVLLMSVAIQSFDIRIEQVALTLGASKNQMLTRILVPNLVPSALAAWIFAFIISFDEVVVTQFVGGRYFTIPKKMFNELILAINPTITAIATILIGLSVVTLAIVMVLMRRAGLLAARFN
jgi:ABC-type spermidine/putrescine transport system permease subunit II